MNATILALRAVTAVFFRRLLLWAIVVAAIIALVLWALLIYLAVAVSGWWWLFLIVLVPATLVALLVGTGLWMASGLLLPRKLSRPETKQVRKFTDKVLGLAETAKMPYPVALLLVAKDVVRRRESSFIRNTIDDSRSLKGDFAKLQDLFR